MYMNRNKRNITNKKVGTIVAIIVMLSLGIFFGLRDFNNRRSNKPGEYNNQQISARVLDKVNRIIYLPSDEVPAIGTIENLDKLSSNKFFSSAKAGDSTLIYTKSKKVILYRESENKIVNICWSNCEFSYEGFSN
jgi:hypothetical protein